MAVDVQRGAGVGMPKPVLQLFHVPAFVDEQGGAGVPQFVQGDFWPAVSLCRLTEQLGYVVRVIRRPIFLGEDISIVLVIVAPERPVFLLISPDL